MKVQLKGEFRMVAVNADTGEERLLADWFPNLITNSGLDAIGMAGNPVYACAVGSGNTPPTVLNSTLQSQVASTNVGGSIGSASAAVSAPYATTLERSWRFDAGVAAGNLSEVGIFSYGPVMLFSRSLIKDTEGNPTTITVLSNEFLDVSYRLSIYYPESDVTGALLLGSTTHGFTVRPSSVTYASSYPRGAYAQFNATASAAYVYASPATIGPVTDSPTTAHGYAIAGVTNDTYVPGSYRITGSLNLALDSANWPAGISALIFPLERFSGMVYQAQFTPPIPKANTQTLKIDVAVSWGRRP